MASIQEVSVHYRHVELQSSAKLQETGDGGLFLELAEPPPVRTLLELRTEGSAHGHAYEITAVVEVESAGTSRGCHLRRLDDAALSTRPVGSERLADASGGPSSPTGTMSAVRSRSDEGEESWSDEYGAHMAVPAPVVLSDGGADDPGDSTEGAAESGDEGGDDESAAVSTDSGESPPAGKKRRGRRRK